jgi:hypothetical protein
MPVNNLSLTYLEPLLKWRVLDVQTLINECPQKPEYFNFCKTMRKLEKQNIIQSFRHPFSRKKYLYLTSLGEESLTLTDHPTSISKETLLHDIKVSEIVKILMDEGYFYEASLEHELHNKKNFKVSYKIIPDALLITKRHGVDVKVALEVELSRKSIPRIVEKAQQYMNSSLYHYVIYFFNKQIHLDRYRELLIDRIGPEIEQRFFFFADETLATTAEGVLAARGFFKGNPIVLGDVFKGK